MDRDKEDVFQQCEVDERQRIRSLLTDLHASWQEINEAYTDRHRYGLAPRWYGVPKGSKVSFSARA